MAPNKAKQLYFEKKRFLHSSLHHVETLLDNQSVGVEELREAGRKLKAADNAFNAAHDGLPKLKRRKNLEEIDGHKATVDEYFWDLYYGIEERQAEADRVQRERKAEAGRLQQEEQAETSRLRIGNEAEYRRLLDEEARRLQLEKQAEVSEQEKFKAIKEEHKVTVDLPDKCVEIQYPTKGDVGQVNDDQGKAVACEVALESELSCDKTGKVVNVEIPR